VDEAASISTEPVASWQAHEGRVYSLAFSSDGDRLLSGAADGRVVSWKHFEPAADARLHHAHRIADFADLPGASSVVTVGNDGIHLWGLGRDAAAVTLSEEERPRSCVACSGDGRLAAVGDKEGHVQIWDIPGRTIRATWRVGDVKVDRLAFSPDGSTLACVDSPGGTVVRLFDVRANRISSTLPAPVAEGVAFSPDGSLVAASSENDVHVWQVESGELVGTLRGHGSTVCEIAFSPDGQLIATASNDRLVKLWDWQARTERFSLAGHRDRVYTVAFSADGRTLASGGRDGELKLWHVPTGKPFFDLASEDRPIHKVAFDSSGTRLECLSGPGNEVRLFEAASGPAAK
jgi:WD40 repeat protein